LPFYMIYYLLNGRFQQVTNNPPAARPLWSRAADPHMRTFLFGSAMEGLTIDLSTKTKIRPNYTNRDGIFRGTTQIPQCGTCFAVRGASPGKLLHFHLPHSEGKGILQQAVCFQPSTHFSANLIFCIRQLHHRFNYLIIL